MSHDSECASASVTPRTENVVRRLPAPIQKAFLAHLREPAAGEAELRSELDSYLAELEHQTDEGNFYELPLGQELTRRCHSLLDRVGGVADEESWQLVQAAVRYFVDVMDASNDMSSLVGLEDDAIVIIEVENAVV